MNPAPETGGASQLKRPRIVVPHKADRWQRLAGLLVFGFERLLTASLRWRFVDESSCFEPGMTRPVIFCIWHNRLALSMAIYRKQFKARPLASLVSASKDGALLAQILEAFSVQPVRGSSSRRGPQALLELTSWAQKGFDLAITPDGPRGPRYRVQEGVLALAQLTGLPIVPVTCRLQWKLTFRSWDRFQLPLPLSRCEILFGRPFLISRDASIAERSVLRQQLENVMADEPIKDGMA